MISPMPGKAISTQPLIGNINDEVKNNPLNKQRQWYRLKIIQTKNRGGGGLWVGSPYN